MKNKIENIFYDIPKHIKEKAVLDYIYELGISGGKDKILEIYSSISYSDISIEMKSKISFYIIHILLLHHQDEKMASIIYSRINKRNIDFNNAEYILKSGNSFINYFLDKNISKAYEIWKELYDSIKYECLEYLIRDSGKKIYKQALKNSDFKIGEQIKKLLEKKNHRC